MNDGNPQSGERLVPRILNSSRDLIIDEVLVEMLKYLGPKHKAVEAVEALKGNKNDYRGIMR
jgi:hypothetical protein